MKIAERDVNVFTSFQLLFTSQYHPFGIALFIGLGLVAFQFNKNSQQSTQSVEPTAVQQKFERWQVKSIYDGDTLRVVRDNEELKIRFFGTDSPEIKQPMGIEARDHLRAGFARSLRDRSLSWEMVNYF